MSDDRTNALEALNAAPAGTPAGSFWGGTLSAIPRGLADAGAQFVMQNAEMLPRNAGQGMTEQQYEAPAQSDAEYQQGLKDTQVAVGNYLRPNPYTTGVVGNTLFGVSDVGARAALGTALGGPVGAATMVGGSTGQQADIEAQAQGVDSGTALKMGVASGAFNAAALGVPMSFGGNVLARAVTGAAVNTALQQGGQQLTSRILDKAGYSTMAAQYRETDAATIASDIVLGAFFGAHHTEARGVPEPSVAAVDAATTAQADARYQTEAAPGAPVNAAGIQAHSEAMDTARTQLLNDEPVQLGNTLKDAAYIPIPDPENRAQAVDALKESGYVPSDPVEPAASRPTTEEIQQRFADVLSDPEAAREAYAALPDSNGGNTLSTDTARELSPDYLADRTRSADVHDQASAFIKQEYADRLAQPTPEGKDAQVLITGGGTGAGKTTSLDLMGDALGKPEITYDTNMNKFGSADAKIQQALAAGRKVHVMYIYREPVEALVNGALSRSERQAQKFGTGRTVPLAEHAATHVGARKVMDQLAEKYKNNPDVQISTFDNSRGKGNGQFVNLDTIPRIDENGLHEKLQTALEAERAAGKISDATYRGFAGEDSAVQQGAGGEAVQRGNEEEAGRGSEKSATASQETGNAGSARDTGSGRDTGRAGNRESGESAGPEVRQLSPEETRAQAIAAERPETPISYTDENGNEVTETAAQALARNEEESGTIQRMADAVRAAVSCALRFGE